MPSIGLPLAFLLMLFTSACISDELTCLNDFCRTKQEAIRQVDWIASRLLERHPDGIAPANLEDALGMRLPSVLPAGGTLTDGPDESGASFDLVLSNGREVGLDYTNGSPDGNALGLSLMFSRHPPYEWCAWSNRDPTWRCLER